MADSSDINRQLAVLLQYRDSAKTPLGGCGDRLPGCEEADMVRFRIRIAQPPRRYITLEFLEGRPLVKGTWRRVPTESNSSLGEETGAWENWVLGTLGGARCIRLYDTSDIRVAVLEDFPSRSSCGRGSIVVPGFGGEFGDEDFDWTQISAAPLRNVSLDGHDARADTHTAELEHSHSTSERTTQQL
jgi:hypothetical protein